MSIDGHTVTLAGVIKSALAQKRQSDEIINTGLRNAPANIFNVSRFESWIDSCDLPFTLSRSILRRFTVSLEANAKARGDT